MILHLHLDDLDEFETGRRGNDDDSLRPVDLAGLQKFDQRGASDEFASGRAHVRFLACIFDPLGHYGGHSGKKQTDNRSKRLL